MQYRRALIALAVAAGLTLTACSDDEKNTSAEFNDADVAFAQEMIPHHEQAVEMSQLAEDRASSPEVGDLASDIEGAQGPEIETMTGWLEDWDEDVPDSSMAGMDHGSGDEMAGMMTEDQMAELEAASGAKFDRLFLDLMIEHHEGAIEMAKTEQADGEDADAIAMAVAVEKAQTAEIATMQDLLGS